MDVNKTTSPKAKRVKARVMNLKDLASRSHNPWKRASHKRFDDYDVLLTHWAQAE